MDHKTEFFQKLRAAGFSTSQAETFWKVECDKAESLKKETELQQKYKDGTVEIDGWKIAAETLPDGYATLILTDPEGTVHKRKVPPAGERSGFVRIVSKMSFISEGFRAHTESIATNEKKLKDAQRIISEAKERLQSDKTALREAFL